ncbi:N-methylhydantoinase A/oxoprolinase/acetone carboxylase beta subunit [Methanohalophilus levihalophilus]|uniref:hydantoinase/oxoprolinase family protein n=1 Tax=Methanohalophilus levihalophilus TaxID=1431282 RepID=UPI001AE8FDD2|nr:hydantoinase/oxoprolinase family protein [Methanohalophilus levihalophilus]MBP2029547.1 N-methylhydantoinase A/oxoprolinase/acetone carboxylase beta subunit [Methanohalophilus levihalophilus]
MKYSLGIDAGGTYTDAVILRDSDGEIVAKMKARTTYPDLLLGIQNALDGLDQSYLDDVSLVSVSTTLATNTILEGTGYPVALIMVGEADIPADASLKYAINIEGGHTPSGNEKYPLDIEAAEAFINEVGEKVSAFAVSSYFSIRNPEHELRIKELITNLTALPVVCGHELSQSLGAYERGITAYLNAQLLPISTQFMDTVVSEIRRRGIEAKMMMLKCDGSIVGIREALKHPIESIFTGPAASLVGASYLANRKNCVVLDVGGTSTDVAMIIDGFPEITGEGAIVGGWRTKVEAIRMETSALGGDSHVWTKNEKLYIGPKRVIPLCVAATQYSDIHYKLTKKQHIMRSQLGENIQPAKMFLKTEHEPIELTEREEELLGRIDDTPRTINEVYWEKSSFPSPKTMTSLIQKRLVQGIGFTPTDALHVLGIYNEWDTEASKLGASLIGNFCYREAEQISAYVKEEFTKNMALNVLSYVFEHIPSSEIRKALDHEYYGQFKVNVPVVLLGGPVSAYVNDVGKYMDAEIILPEHSEVGNAVGALAGRGLKRIEILVRPNYSKAMDYNLKTDSVSSFYPGGKEILSSYDEAIKFSEEMGTKLIMEYMKDAELSEGEISIDIKRKDLTFPDSHALIETRLILTGTADLRNGNGKSGA